MDSQSRPRLPSVLHSSCPTPAFRETTLHGKESPYSLILGLIASGKVGENPAMSFMRPQQAAAAVGRGWMCLLV
jgi:hypothetical protein